MIHLILLLLKWISWILLAILGILVLLICIALFVPVRYEAEGSYKNQLDSAKGKIKVSFLLHLLSGTAIYEKQELKWKIRIAWKKWQSEEEDTPPSLEIEQAEEEKSQKEELHSEAMSVSEIRSQTVTEITEKGSAQKTTEEYTVEKKTEEQEMSKSYVEKKEKAPKEKKSQKRKKSFEDTKLKGKEWSKFVKKIKTKYDQICVKIKELIRKKEIIMKFLSAEIHQVAFRKCLKEVKRLILKIKPKIVRGNVEFGFDDPYWTGKVLAWASLCYPYYADALEVKPHFEEKILCGDLFVKGKISLVTFVSCGVRLIINKSIRLTIRHIKKIKRVL